MNDDFGVAVGVEAMAAAFEFGAEFGKVVNFAVEDDPGAAVFVEDRLMAAGEINDAEAPHPKSRAVLDEDALVVRTAVDDLVAHVPYESFGDIAHPGWTNDSSDSTHDLFF